MAAAEPGVAPTTTSRPVRPADAGPAEARGSASTGTPAASDPHAAAARVGGHQVDAVAHREEVHRAGVGQPDRDRHQAVVPRGQRRADQAHVGERLAATQRGGQDPADRVARQSVRDGPDGVGRRRQVVGAQHRAGLEVVGRDEDPGRGLGRRGQGPQRRQHRDRGEQRGQRSTAGQHRAAPGGQPTSEPVPAGRRTPAWGRGVGHAVDARPTGAAGGRPLHRVRRTRARRAVEVDGADGADEAVAAAGVEDVSLFWEPPDDEPESDDEESLPESFEESVPESEDAGGRAAAAVVAVEAGALEDHADRVEDLAQPPVALGTVGQRVLVEALHRLEPVPALGAGVLVGGHGLVLSRRWHSPGLTANDKHTAGNDPTMSTPTERPRGASVRRGAHRSGRLVGEVALDLPRLAAAGPLGGVRRGRARPGSRRDGGGRCRRGPAPAAADLR